MTLTIIFSEHRPSIDLTIIQLEKELGLGGEGEHGHRYTCLGDIKTQLLQHTLHRVAFGDIAETSTGVKCSCGHVDRGH